MKQLDELKDKVQKEIIESIDNHGGFGLVEAATGTGKSKPIVDMVKKMFNSTDLPKVLLVVPTEKLKDDNWKKEFEDWDASEQYSKMYKTCYPSLKNYKNGEWDFVILDECHNITERNSVFFDQNTVHSCVGLTALAPKNKIKVDLLATILRLETTSINRYGDRALIPTYQVKLSQAVEAGLVAPYEITIITVPIDNTDKYVEAGNATKRFMQTEYSNYKYLTGLCNYGDNPMARIRRMHFMYNLKSKTEAAKLVLEHVIPKDLRTLIFCGSRDQANKVHEHRYYSRPTKPTMPTKLKGAFDSSTNSFDIAAAAKLKEYNKYIKDLAKYEEALKEYQGDKYYNLFKEGSINRLSCVDALNEGENIEGLDVGFMIKTSGQEMDMIQRLGRIIRRREGHVGKIIILATEYTIDIEWVEKSIVNLDKSKVKIVSLEDLRTKKEKITF